MTDYISREETLKAIQPRYAPAINKVLAGIIESVPAADVKPVAHGEWGNYDEYNDGYRCSRCKLIHRTVTKFCPNCGAKMDIYGTAQI